MAGARAFMKKRLLLFGAVLLVAGGFLILAQNLKPIAPVEPTPSYSREELTLIKRNNDELLRVVFRQPSATWEIYEGPENWLIKGEEQSSVNQSYVESTLYRVVSVIANDIVTDKPTPEQLKNWGLGETATTVTSTYQDGKSYTLKIGTRMPVENQHYLQMVGDERVYAVSGDYADFYSKKISDFLVVINANVTAEYITDLTIKRKGLPPISIRRTGEDKLKYNPFRLVQPYGGRPVRVQELANLITVLVEVRMGEFVSNNPKDLTPYGLKEPYAEVICEDSLGAKVQYLVGDIAKKDSTMRYVLNKADDIVYLVSNESLQFVTIPSFLLAEKFVQLLYLESLEKIEVTGKKGNFNMTMIRPSNAPIEQTPTYIIDGSPVTQEKAKAFYRVAFAGVYLHGEITDPAAVVGEPEMTIQYIRRKNLDFADITLEFIPYGPFYYAVKENGKTPQFYIHRSNAEYMYTVLNQFKEGKLS